MNNLTIAELEKLAQERRTKNISARALAEQKINEWVDRIMTLPEKYKIPGDNISHETISLQKLMPEWYEEYPDKEKLEEQRKRTNEFFAKYNQLSMQLKAQAQALLNEEN